MYKGLHGAMQVCQGSTEVYCTLLMFGKLLTLQLKLPSEISIVEWNTDSTLNLSSLMLILMVYYLLSTIKVKGQSISDNFKACSHVHLLCYVMCVMFTVESLIVLDKNEL